MHNWPFSAVPRCAPSRVSIVMLSRRWWHCELVCVNFAPHMQESLMVQQLPTRNMSWRSAPAIDPSLHTWVSAALKRVHQVLLAVIGCRSINECSVSSAWSTAHRYGAASEHTQSQSPGLTLLIAGVSW